MPSKLGKRKREHKSHVGRKWNGYKAFKSGLTKPLAWQVGRDARRYVLNYVACYELSAPGLTATMLQGALSQNFVFAPRLADFPGGADVIATYDSFKVLSAEMWFAAQLDPKYTVASGQSAEQEAEWMKSIIDINDSTTVTGTAYDHYSSVQYHRVGEDFYRKWQPAYLNTSVTGVNTISDQKDEWVSVVALGPTVPFLSCKVFMPPYVSANQAVRYTLRVRLSIVARSQS